jgi:CheY-like chemotaxis protein
VSGRNLPDFSGLTFLIVEDSDVTRQLLSDLLRVCGAVVVEASSIRAAKEQVGTRKLDMIVTDLALPDEDGAMFLKWLRAQPAERGGRVPALVVTAFYERYGPDDLTGWTAYLQKPVEIGQFVRTVADILRIPTPI